MTLLPWLLAVGGGILGAIFGSFIGALCSRWPGGRSVMTGRSHCDHCQRTLTAAELLPLISYLLQKGQCRHCGGSVDRDQFWAELSAAAIGVCAFAFLALPQAVIFAVMAWLLLPLIFLDYRHLWLPGRLTFILALSGPLLCHWLLPGYDLALQLWAGAGAFAAMELLRLLFKLLRGKDGMGAGDPKLFGAIALWIPPPTLPFLLLIASGTGLFIAFMLRSKGAAFSSKMLPFGSMLGFAAIIVQCAAMLTL
ncbi:MAG: prepilin peptidase [Sphingomonadales bacterium]|nr:prepilin peptidase [Sphingomonadales bacterium]